MNCFVCHTPFHPASGGLFGHQNTPFCGACVRGMIVLFKERTARRHGEVQFYAHAYPPPPGGARGLAADFAETLAKAGHPVTPEVALEAAVVHIGRGKAEAAGAFRRAGVPLVEKRGGKFGAAGTPCTTWAVGSRTLMMG